MKISDYSKNELPTWNEVYNEFYQEGPITSSPSSEKDPIDVYYKIPRSHVLMGMICNQFNKMIEEDGYREQVLDILRESMVGELFNCIFQLIPQAMHHKYFHCTNNIYTFTTKKDIFAISDRSRKYVNDVSNNGLEMYMIVITKFGGQSVPSPEYYSYDSYEFNAVMEILMRPFIEYFTKPKEKQERKPFDSSMDPAL